jgi:hypothetical protein
MTPEASLPRVTPDEALIEAYDLGVDEAGYTDAMMDRAEQLLPVLIDAGYAATDDARSRWWFTDAGIARVDAPRSRIANLTPGCASVQE